MKKAIFIVPFLFWGIAFSYAQSLKKASTGKLEIFTYDSDNCSGNKGYFNPEKYSRTQIEGAYHLFTGNFLIIGPHFFNLETLEEVRKNWKKHSRDLEKDYREKTATFQKIHALPHTPYWNGLKEAIGEGMQENYEYEQFRLQVFRDYNALKQRQVPEKCKRYADAIMTKDQGKKLAIWKELALEQSRNNADPERIMYQYETLSQSDQKDDYAFLYLFNFGYNNCNKNEKANSTANRDDKDYRQFESLFEKIVAGDCDEP